MRLDRTKLPQLLGLKEGIIPIIPAEKTFDIQVPMKSGDTITKTVQRRQLPITPAYTFTDYRSQGQTISLIVIDIATPAHGGPLSLFNIYVAVSRNSGRGTTRLLRDFDDSIFFWEQDQALLVDGVWLEALNEATKSWYL